MAKHRGDMSLDQLKIWHSTYEALVQAVQVAERTHTPNFTGPRGYARKMVNAMLSTLNVLGVEGVKPDPHLHRDIRGLYADGSMGEGVMPVVEIDGKTYQPTPHINLADEFPGFAPMQGMSFEEVRARLNPAPPAFQEQYMQQHLNEPVTDPGYWDRKPEPTAEDDFVEGEAISQEPEILLQSDPRMAHAHIYEASQERHNRRRCVRCLEWEPEDNLDDLLDESDSDYGTLEGNAKERF